MNPHRAMVKGIHISYLFSESECDRSNSGNRDVLYIHGNTGCNLWFSKVMQQPGCRVFAPDMPNFGESDHIDCADIDTYADYMADFIQEMRLSAPIIVGHSLGGGVGMSIATRYPELVSALVLVDSCAPDGLVIPEEHYPAIEAYKTNQDFMRQGLAAVCPSLDDPDFLDKLTNQAMKMNPIAFSGNARALARFSVVGSTDRFAGPVLVMYGEKDIIITEKMAERTAAAFASSKLEIISDVGHSVIVERPELFTESLQNFIANNFS
ncbi:alpha/beta fold hydrolase [Alkalispirochaeta alkalica]|uniref:alpha/beta fold hydrolase n=1 Tax=Alkalispirochaeta alkalica TaxID=46356 RepID=UPI000A0752E9|nr:alpha/beta hydrolase [Alkalispirochaeta alkalica]